MFVYKNNNFNEFKKENSFRFLKDDRYINSIISYNSDLNKLEFKKRGSNLFFKALKLTDSSILNIISGTMSDIIEFQLTETFKKLYPSVKTYLREILNKLNDIEYGYKVQIGIYYKHFPFKLKIDPDKVIISNYLGYKNDLVLKYKDIQIKNINEKVYEVSGYDRIIVLNFISQLERIKYNTKLNKLDPRKFMDSIYKIKNVT